LLKIEVAGNLGNQERSDNILKQSVRSLRSVAAQHVLVLGRKNKGNMDKGKGRREETKQE